MRKGLLTDSESPPYCVHKWPGSLSFPSTYSADFLWDCSFVPESVCSCCMLGSLFALVILQGLKSKNCAVIDG